MPTKPLPSHLSTLIQAMMTPSQRLKALKDHLNAGVLTLEQVGQRLEAEAEAVLKLETDEREARETLMMVSNHSLAGVSIYAKARDVAERRIAAPVDGANTKPSDGGAVR